MIDAFSLPDLRRRILITLGILVAFRLLAHVPLPGVDAEALSELFGRNALLGMIDLFSGGALKYFSVVAMGVFPYITATIVMQLMTPVIPRLRALAQEGESGRNRINLFTHWLTVPMAGLAGYSQIILLQSENVLASTDALPTVAMIMALIAGTMFLVWLGEQITQFGIGNGVSIIIFAGIVAGLPEMIGSGFLATDDSGYGDERHGEY
jgi:preprotein translocase subunit SecY